MSFADNHMFTGNLDPEAPINIQVQICKLNAGKTQAQYDKMVAEYWAWAKKNDVEVTFIRQTPYLTHANPENPSNYDFVEFLASDYETSGKSWDLWMSTAEGQKLNAKWQSLAKCDVKMASIFTKWAKVEELNNDDNRIVTWNWCSRKEGVTPDQLKMKHDSIAASYPDGLGNIGWFLFFPQIGGKNAPADFAHVVVYPDVAGLMKHQQWFSEGGWRARQDYYNSYADCTGESANVEVVMNRPSS